MTAPAGVRWVTCGYCAARLEIHRSGNAFYTEVLEAIETKTREIAADLETIKIQNELEQLDRAWAEQRDACMIREKDGAASVPNKTVSTIGTVIAVAFGVFWTGLAGAMFPPMALFGLVFIGFAVYGGLRSAQKADQYNRAKQAYDDHRETLLQALRQQQDFENDNAEPASR